MSVYGDYLMQRRENEEMRHSGKSDEFAMRLENQIKSDPRRGGVIILNSSTARKNRIDFNYDMTEELLQFFAPDQHFFFEYADTIDLGSVPESILNVPFVMNLIPLVWLSDSVMYIKTLDKNFYDCLDEIKLGFKRVYPSVKFGGRLVVEKLEVNEYPKTGKTTIFFTGGVDATASLIINIKKKPEPFYILGADVDLSDTQNIAAAQRDVPASLQALGFRCHFIRSSIRYFFDGVKITNYFEKQLKDSWWHGAQHSIGMLSLMAPYAYLNRIDTCIIAASFTAAYEGKINCVSFPFIDDALCFGSTGCYHDGYDMTRQDKINLITSFCAKHNVKLNLRVCFSPINGQNCNHCEKCMRTIMAIRATGYDPNNYGFSVKSSNYAEIHEYLSNNLLYHTAHWEAIRAEFRKHKKKWEKDPDVSWILNIKFNSFKIYACLGVKKIRRILKKILRIGR